MITKNWKCRCDLCGKFVPFHTYYTWTYYGNVTDLEPPETQHSHKDCFDGLDGEEKALIIKMSWIKPRLYEFNEMIDENR